MEIVVKALLLVLAITFIMVMIWLLKNNAGTLKHCTLCGHDAEPRMKSPGSFIGELFFWIVIGFVCYDIGTWWPMLAPMGFTIYRAVARHEICSKCGHQTLIPLDSPALQAENQTTAKE